MNGTRNLEHRMAAIFGVALVLLGWQALRLRPVLPPAYEVVTKRPEQLVPFAVASWRVPPELPAEPAARGEALVASSVLWPGSTAGGDCTLFAQVSALHWVRRPVGRAVAPGSWFWTAADFADDDDGDGDLLDPGELRREGPGAEAEVHCAGGEAAASS